MGFRVQPVQGDHAPQRQRDNPEGLIVGQGEALLKIAADLGNGQRGPALMLTAKAGQVQRVALPAQARSAVIHKGLPVAALAGQAAQEQPMPGQR